MHYYTTQKSGIAYSVLQKLVYLTYCHGLVFKDKRILNERPWAFIDRIAFESIHNVFGLYKDRAIVGVVETNPFENESLNKVLELDEEIMLLIKWVFTRYACFTPLELREIVLARGGAWDLTTMEDKNGKGYYTRTNYSEGEKKVYVSDMAIKYDFGKQKGERGVE